VFVKEQGVPAEIELDRAMSERFSYWLPPRQTVDGACSHACRRAKIGRMAVRKDLAQRVGTKLLTRAVATARRLHAQAIYLPPSAVIGFMKPWFSLRRSGF